jgi:glycosyltransferase involved in cell wall biosynthesis
MTTYNGALFLREQLDSIFAQTRLPNELIVCDDRSSDETPQLLSDYAARAPVPMIVVINDQRLGSTRNFEQAIRLCSGDLIALCDQDDVWYPHKLQVIERRFEDDPDLGLVFSNGDLIDEKGGRLRGELWRKFLFSRDLQKILRNGDAHRLVLAMPFMTGATMVFRSKFNSLILPMPMGIPTFIHDRWIGVLIAAVARIGMIEDRLIAYRLHAQQQLGAGKLQRYFQPHRCSSDQLGLAAVQERLNDNPAWTAKPKFLDALAERQPHVAARASFSGGLIGRVPAVVREYCSGRYGRYPLAMRIAVKDLLFGTQ